jgi:hypothetical protein
VLVVIAIGFFRQKSLKRQEMVTKEGIEEIASVALAWPKNRKWDTTEKNARFRSCFGASSEVVATIWNRIEPTIDEPGLHAKHLLWALVFLKVYSTEDIHCSIFDWPSVRTFRKWSWYIVKKIADLKDEVIRLENRFQDGPDPNLPGKKCYLTVDGTDCPVFEPRPFNTGMYSKKMQGPGLKYEVAVCIRTGSICWINGPFKASTHDATIFNNGLSNEIADNEVVEADRGYSGCAKAKTPNQGFTRVERQQKSKARGRHEAINGRLKHFGVLTTHFRHMAPNLVHMMEKHGLCFTAIAVISQLKFEHGDQVFDVEYNVNYDHDRL